MDTTIVCSKCDSPMMEGFVVQKLDGLTVPLTTWVEGVPERTLLGSTKMPAEKTRSITTYCCSNCGFLEFHARQQ